VGRRRGAVVLGALVLTELALVRLGRSHGSTRDERRASLPGDGLVREPTAVTDHAITIDAPPERVWPWLVQMGWGRGGWYTARWVDRLLFPANGPSAERLVPELQRLAVGDRVPDGAPEAECAFVVERLEPGRALVLRSTTHLPLAWRRRGTAAMDWWSVSTIVLRPRRSISPATSSMSASRRAVTTTSAPASASPSASTRPMPLVPPTTTTVLPVRSNNDRVMRG